MAAGCQRRSVWWTNRRTSGPYSNAAWEKLSIFLTFLTPKLPAPVEPDLARGILESIDMDSYRVEKRAALSPELPDEDAEIGAVPVGAAATGKKPSSIASPPSSRSSTSSSATSTGPTSTA